MTGFARRRVLASAAALLVGASGCTGAGSEDTPTATATEQAFDNCVRDPPTSQVRHPRGRPAIRSSAVSPTGDWGSTEWIVSSASERAALDYASDATGVEATTAFVDETDLSAHALLVHQHTFDECLSLALERLKWARSENPPEDSFDLGLEYADADRGEHCEHTGSPFTIATVVRMPAEIAAIGRFTWGTAAVGRNDC